MIYALVFVAGMVAPYVAWFGLATLHDYVYMPLWWEPRHIKACRNSEPFKTNQKLHKEKGCDKDKGMYCIYCANDKGKME